MTEEIKLELNQIVDEDIPIDKIILIPCPLHAFKLKQVKNCITCPRYAGLMVVNISGIVPWNEARRVVCTAPIARRTEVID